jgi:NAD(P)-dependent dehydrogenase (short-subunit alcohol dehydrogenase family)
MNMEHRIGLDRKIVLITGGYGHLGSGITAAMLQHGATVVVLGRSEKSFEEKRSTLIDSKNLYFRYCDISSSASVRDAFTVVNQSIGQPDVLVNNAYFLRGQIPEKLTDEDWATGIDGTLNSVFRCIREIMPFISEGGRIINIGSMYGSVSPDFKIYKDHPTFFNPPNYGAAKAGIAQLTRYFAHYLGPKNITVNCVSPGSFPSETVQAQESFIHEIKSRTALGRIGTPEDLGGICVFLASSHAAYITGQNIHVDGGWTSI